MPAIPPTRSSLASRVTSGYRQILVALCLLLALWIVSRFTTFRTHVKFTSRQGRLELSVNQRTVHADARIGRVSKIEIETLNSVFPMGGESLSVSRAGRLVFKDRLPRRFRIQRGNYAPLGDWSLDPVAGRGIVYERSVALTDDLTLEAVFTGRCTEFTSIRLVGEPQVIVQFRRGLLNNDFVINVAGRVLAVDALVSPRSQMALDTLDIFVRSLMAGCFLVLLFAALRRLLVLTRDHPIQLTLHRARTAVLQRWVAVCVGCIVLIALGIRVWVSKSVLEGLAHTPDEVAYMLQAKWLLANRLYESAPPILEHLSVPFTYFRDGKWFSMYPIGWPLLLTVGQAIGLPWIVSPILGALYVLLLFLIGKEMGGRLVGLAAAVLGAISPMAVLMFSSYLSHGSAALMIALFLWLYLLGRRRRSLWLFGLSGASLGYAFSIRPLTAVAIACPFAILLLWEFVKSKEALAALRGFAAFFAGGVLGSFPVLVANHLITGHALSFAYGYGAGTSFSIQNLSAGLLYLDATVASVLPAVFGWGWGVMSGWQILSLSLAFACVPFLLRRPRSIEVLFAAMFIALPLSFLTWGYHGLHGYGPRFYFEAFLGIYLLTAQGFVLLAGIDTNEASVRFRWGRGVAALALVLLAGLVLSTVVTLRSRMRLYEGYNGVSGSLETAIAHSGIHRALILLPGTDWFPWGAASNLLESHLHADLAFAISRGDNSKLLAFYPDRPVYMWSGSQLTLLSIRPVSSAVPTPLRTPESPPVARLTTVLGWWVAVSAAVLGVPLFRRLRHRRRDALVTQPARPEIARESAVVRPHRQTTPRRARDAPRRLPISRAVVGSVGILGACLGQCLLLSNGLTRWLSAAGLSGVQQLLAGSTLLVAGAIAFGLAWRGFDPFESEYAARAEPEELPPTVDDPEATRVDSGVIRAGRGTSILTRARWALACATASLYLYNSWDWLRNGERSSTRWLWALSVVLFVASLVPLQSGRDRPIERRNGLPRLPAVILLGLVTAIALSLRFVGLASVPLDVHGDFASIGLGARDLLEGRVSALFATGWAALPWAAFLPSALSMRIFGDSLFGLDMGAVIAGTVTVVGIYVLAATLFDRSVALIAAAISAVGYAEIHFSRVSAYIDPVPWIVFGLYFLLRGLRSEEGWAFGVAGILLAVGFEMYYSGRVIVLILVLFFAYLALFHARVLLRCRKGLSLLLAAGVLTTGPMLLFYWRNPGNFMSRTREVYTLSPGNMAHLLNKYNTESPFRVLFEQTWRSLLMFNQTTDSSTQFGFPHPLVNPALAPLLILGVGVSAWRLRRTGHGLLLIWLATGVVAGSILAVDAPFWPRLVVLLPAASILAAVGIFAALATLLRLMRRPLRPWLVLIPAAGILAGIGHRNWQWYFHGSMSTYVAPIAWVGRLIGQAPTGTAFCMIRGPLDLGDRVPRFLGKGHELLDFPSDQLDQYQDQCLAEGRAWILIRPDHDELLASLNRRWPQARQEQHDFPSGQPGPIFWYPPPEARLAAPRPP